MIVQTRTIADNVFSYSAVRLVDPVAMSEVPHPIPFRTRSLSPPEPMVLRLKARESRSPPGLPGGQPMMNKNRSRGPSRNRSSFSIHYRLPRDGAAR